MKFLCIGDQDTVTGFRFAGVEGVIVADADAARQAFDQALHQADVAVVILADPFAAALQKEINAVRFTRLQPTIVEIPGPQGFVPGRPRLIELVREAVGVQL